MDESESVPFKHRALLLISQILSFDWKKALTLWQDPYPPLDSSQRWLLFQANSRCVLENPRAARATCAIRVHRTRVPEVV